MSDPITALGLKVLDEFAPLIDIFEERVYEDPEPLIQSIEKIDEVLLPLNPNRKHLAFALGTQVGDDAEFALCIIALCAGRKMERPGAFQGSGEMSTTQCDKCGQQYRDTHECPEDGEEMLERIRVLEKAVDDLENHDIRTRISVVPILLSDSPAGRSPLAKYVGISSEQLRQLIEERRIPHSKQFGFLFARAADVLKAIES